MKRFLFAALLWLPAMFFLWFWLAGPLVWPVVQIMRFVLLHGWPQLFTAVVQGADLLDAHGRVLGHPGYLVQLSTGVLVNVAEAGAAPKFGFLEPVINPLVYGYSLPLFAGLVLATPQDARSRLVKLGIGIPLLWLAQALGGVAESLKVVLIDSGPVGAEAAQRAGLSLNLIALCYQFGYLILPSLLPVVLWIAGNQRFIAQMTADRRPGAGPASGEA